MAKFVGILFTCLLAVTFAESSCETSCPQSGSSQTDCNFVCNCTLPSEGLSRWYGCTALLGAPGFFWVNTTIVGQNATVSVSYTTIAGAVVPIAVNETTDGLFKFEAGASINETHTMFSIVTNSTSNHTNTTNNTLSTGASVYFYTDAIPCVAAITPNADTMSLSWSISAKADKLVSWSLTQDGVVVPFNGTSFTAAPSCGKVSTFQVWSSLLGHDCNASASATLKLSTPPSAPTSIAASSVTGNASLISVNASWGVPAVDGHCPSNGFSYNVSIWSNNAIISTTLYAPGSYVVSGSVAMPNTLFLATPAVNSSFDVNAVYTLSVSASSPGGSSDLGTSTFTLPGAVPASDSSSGFSNTVIAGIAVGATVGVVAIALFIYKCSSSKKGYESVA